MPHEPKRSARLSRHRGAPLQRATQGDREADRESLRKPAHVPPVHAARPCSCLLYTSDAADDM
eukprot:2158678-Alexandrium_andersonii.AAC.1